MAAATRLILFTRAPVAGKVKTRLIPALGAEGAAALHRRLTDRTIGEALSASASLHAALELRVAGAPARWPGFTGQVRGQGPGSLGARMSRALGEALAQGAGSAILFGSDIPELCGRHLIDANAALADHDLALGPAGDGGYYLVGLKAPCPALFRRIAWGSGAVLERTLAAAHRQGLKTALIEVLHDLDRPEDLVRWPELTA